MKQTKWLATLLLFGASSIATAADFIEVSNTITVNAGLEKVWSKVGDFCAIQEWHPAVVNCETAEAHGMTFRTLTLGDGGTILESNRMTADTSYNYHIEQSPLPVKEYDAKFVAEGDDSSTTLTWSAKFMAKDATDEEAEAVIQGIFDAGMISIQAMFK